MDALNQLYRHSLSLLTDFYQLTMAYGYWKTQHLNKEAIFNLYFRNHPFQGGFTIAAGLETALQWLENFKFTAEDLAYLESLTGADKKPLFEPAFLEYLTHLKLTCDIHAIPEGTVVFPNQPLLRVQGELLQCQLLETALLNIINFQTLIATKSTRVCLAAHGDTVLDFGLRRAQGIDGSISATRAAFIGGCSATSNVLAGKILDIPIRGTHAHSWVMSFDSEQQAFEKYAEAMPNNYNIFLVDTYNTLNGVKLAIEQARKLKAKGFSSFGIRLDSGDLLHLSQQARQLLDEAGFPDALIVASNDLDEYQINTLRTSGAKINAWGVGTRLITAYDQPALGGVYKLTAIREMGQDWHYKVKLSEQVLKVSNPGRLQIRRFKNAHGHFVGDVIYNEWQGFQDFPFSNTYEELLIPVMKQGQRIYHSPPLTEIQARVKQQLRYCPPALLNLYYPQNYPVTLEKQLLATKEALVRQVKVTN